MAFATPADRLALRNTDFPLELVVQIIARNGHAVELPADDVDHALAISRDWLDRGATYAEVFRVQDDGTLRSTIGPATKKG